jgi:fructose-1,6-bisphosphatase
MTVPVASKEFAINASNSRFWEPPIRRYVEEALAGSKGPRGKDFNMRWIASLVAEAHRILTRGGVFMYPRDTKDAAKPGRLRLLYEANPIGRAPAMGRSSRSNPNRRTSASAWCSVRARRSNASSATTPKGR